jgi:allantoinase
MAPLLDTPIVPLSTLPVHQPPYTPPEELPTVLVSNNVVFPGRRQAPGTIVISPHSGKIINVFPEIIPESRFPSGTQYTDYSPKYLMPGLVDAHVHLNEPGWRTEWEGFKTGTRAAASGGVTTVIDMPLNAIPPTTTVENLNTKLKAAKGQCWVDVGFYGGVIPGNEDELIPLVKAGVRGFKCFLIQSGVCSFPPPESPPHPRSTDMCIATRLKSFPPSPTLMSQKQWKS